MKTTFYPRSLQFPSLLKDSLLGIVISSFYFATAMLGLGMYAVSGFATLIWPPAGIAVGALLAFGLRFWPAIFVGAFAANFYADAPIVTALGIGVGNTLESVFAYQCLLALGFRMNLGRLKDVILFIVVGCGLSPLIAASIGVGSLWVGRVPMENLALTWTAWWLGDVLGILVIAPVILVLGSGIKLKWKLLRIMEAVLLASILVITSLELFLNYKNVFGIPMPQLPYILFPLIVWGAVRFGQIGNVLSIFFLSAIAIFGTSRGLGPFAETDARSSLFILTSFLSVVSITGLVLAAVFSERTAMMKELWRAKEALKKAVMIRDDFLSVASHELRTPLTSLKLQTQLRKRSLEKGDQSFLSNISKFLNDDERQVNRLSRLIDDMLDISRLNTGKFTLNREASNMKTIVSEALDRVALQSVEAGCRVKVENLTDLVGSWDRYRIEQVLVNLLTNAFKYGAGKDVELNLAKKGDHAVVSVRDHGIGIAPKDQKRIFQQFERAVTGDEISGLGLGLYISKQIVDAHGGSISVESSIGEGSVFQVSLPLARNSQIS